VVGWFGCCGSWRILERPCCGVVSDARGTSYLSLYQFDSLLFKYRFDVVPPHAVIEGAVLVVGDSVLKRTALSLAGKSIFPEKVEGMSL
jgi:hypothetical protein